MSDVLPLRPRADRPPTAGPLVLSARDLAALLRLGLRTIRSMDAAGKLPAPVRVGGSVRWRLDEIRAWLDAGAPDRHAGTAPRGQRLDSGPAAVPARAGPQTQRARHSGEGGRRKGSVRSFHRRGELVLRYRQSIRASIAVRSSCPLRSSPLVQKFSD